MPHGRPPESNEDVAALAAVWGREASATAAPQERPPLGPPPRSRRVGSRLLLVAGAAVVVVVAIAAAVVVIGGDEDDRPTDRRADGAPSTTAPWEPGWTAEVTCPRLEVSAELRTTACPLATDDERVYVLEARDDPAADDPVTTLVAIGGADGREVWAVPLAGARDILRYPSIVLVVSPDATSAVDPVTGEVRWTAAGVPVAPLGRDHLLLSLDTMGADGAAAATMTVVDAGTGTPNLSRSGPAPSLTIHPCGDAGLVLVSDLGRLTAHEVVDGSVRWSVEAPYHDRVHPMVCTTEVVLAVEGDDLLVARDVRSGDEVATAETAVPGDRGFANLLDLVGGTVVISADERLVGFSADAVLVGLWQLDLPAGGREAVLAAAGGGVAVVLLGDRAVWYGPDAAIGSEVSLTGRDEAVIEADHLVAWGGGEVLVAPAHDLVQPRRLPLDDVRRAAVSSTHVVLTTRDEVRLYPL